MPIIDEQGAKAISKWFQDKKDTPHTVSFNEVTLELANDRELATLQLILMRNRIKFVVDNPPFSKN